METCSSILVWKIPWTEEPGRLQSMGSELETTEQLSTHAHVRYKIQVWESTGWLKSIKLRSDPNKHFGSPHEVFIQIPKLRERYTET